MLQDAEAYQALLDSSQALEAELRELKLDALRRDIQVGIDQIEAGEYTEYTEETLDELFEEIMSEGRREMEQAA